jgi:hypothetical protein
MSSFTSILISGEAEKRMFSIVPLEVGSSRSRTGDFTVIGMAVENVSAISLKDSMCPESPAGFLLDKLKRLILGQAF